MKLFKSKLVIFSSLVFIFEICALSLGRDVVAALDMSSQYFQIQNGILNIISGQGSSSSYDLNSPMDPSFIQFELVGYSIQSGLSYLEKSEPFRFSLSNLSIDYGDFESTQSISKSINMIISSGANKGYQIFAAEDHPPASANSSFIPNTTCNNSKNPCTRNSAASWTTGKPGFGYNLIGNHILSNFKNPAYFRPLADLSKNEVYTPILSSPIHQITNQAKLTFKINPNKSKDIDKYQNTVSLVAIPGY